MKGLVLTILLSLVTISTNNPVQAQCPTPRAADDACEATRTEYKECDSATRDEEAAERFVREQVLAGKAVKLSDKTGKKVRGCFIRDLLIRKGPTPQVGIMIDGAIIDGPIDLRNAEIPYHVELTHCTFLDDVNLKRSHFLKGLSFSSSHFGSGLHGPGRLDAESATIDKDLDLGDCVFNNCLTFFKGLQVGVDWSVKGAKFAGSADFTGINVGGNFFAVRDDNDRQTEFHGSADFESAKVGVDAGFNNAIFDDWVNFGSAEFNNLSIEETSFNNDVDFRGTTINDFYLCDSKDEKPADRFKKCLTIEDMSFRYMSPEDWDKLQGFLAKSNDQQHQSSYSAQFYASLEDQFRRHGRPDQADDIYIAGREKERQGFSWDHRLISWFEDWSIGYGRHLERLLFPWSLVFLLTGCIVFWGEENMKTKKPEDEACYKGTYKPFWYTLDAFLPIIHLGEADVWTPKQRWRIRWRYVHTIVGNLFVPIGLAALTGIIR